VKTKRLASQVKDRRATVVIRKDDGTAVVCTGDIVGHMLKGFDEKAAKENGVTFVEVSKEDLETDPTWRGVLSKAEDVLSIGAAHSVLIPVDRLIDILESVDTKLVRLDILPNAFGEGSTVQHLVYEDAYDSSILTEYTVDALRVVEMKGVPNKKKLKEGDSVAAIGCVHAESTYYEDSKKRAEMGTPKKKKRVKFGKS